MAMEHLKSVWKEAPAVTRSFTVIPLALHCASWRWSKELNLLKLSLYTFRTDVVMPTMFVWGVGVAMRGVLLDLRLLALALDWIYQALSLEWKRGADQ
eukprot:Skav229509  [mRNA]  locus=scaffold2455:298426:301006:- [translate_table: standard]